MSEENKEKAPQTTEQKEAKDQAQAKQEAPKQEAGKTQEPPKPQEEKAAKKERPSACAKCGKKIIRKGWYYRNGKYYCGKRCWKAAFEETKKGQASPTEQK